MATRVLIERLRSAHLPTVEIHLNVLLTARPGNTSVYSSPAIREDLAPSMSPVGHQLMNRIEMIPGLGELLYCSYSFRFNLALAFDHADIFREVIAILRQILDDEIELHIQPDKQGAPVRIEAEEMSAKFRELTA